MMPDFSERSGIFYSPAQVPWPQKAAPSLCHARDRSYDTCYRAKKRALIPMASRHWAGTVASS